MKVHFDKIDLKFENILQNGQYDNDEERLRKLSHLIFSLLDEKLGEFSSKIVSKSSNSNNISFDHISIPRILVDPNMTDYEIASRGASAICQDIVSKLQ